MAHGVSSLTCGLVTFSRAQKAGSAYEIHVVKSDGSALRALPFPDRGPSSAFAHGFGCLQPAFRHDGKRIVFFLDELTVGKLEEDKHSLWEVNVDGGNPRQIADYRLFDDPLHWRPRKADTHRFDVERASRIRLSPPDSSRGQPRRRASEVRVRSEQIVVAFEFFLTPKSHYAGASSFRNATILPASWRSPTTTTLRC